MSARAKNGGSLVKAWKVGFGDQPGFDCGLRLLRRAVYGPETTVVDVV
jgi:hypothetical protein